MSDVLKLLNDALRILNLEKGDEYRYNIAIPIKEAIVKLNSLEEQIQGLQSLLDFKQQEISVLESKVGEVYGD